MGEESKKNVDDSMVWGAGNEVNIMAPIPYCILSHVVPSPSTNASPLAPSSLTPFAPCDKYVHDFWQPHLPSGKGYTTEIEKREDRGEKE